MPPKLSILELFILTLLDRGMKSKYELQRRGGVSLGSSTPALLRMQAEKLVLQETAGVEGERKRHQIKLSKQGRHFARTAWKAFLMEAPDLDLDSILRLIDISAGYGATAFELADFLRKMARERRLDIQPAPTIEPSALQKIQNEWRSIRIRAG